MIVRKTGKPQREDCMDDKYGQDTMSGTFAKGRKQ